jgi:hypothetical protein
MRHNKAMNTASRTGKEKICDRCESANGVFLAPTQAVMWLCEDCVEPAIEELLGNPSTAIAPKRQRAA